jgi:hypothetical protein
MTMGATQSSKTAEVCGVTMEHVDHARLLKYAKQIKELKILKEAAAGDSELLVETVVGHITAKMKAIQMASCDRCNGIAPDTLDFCPFCGEVNGEPESEADDSSLAASEADAPSVMERAQRTETALARIVDSALVKKADKPMAAPVVAGSEDDLEEAVGIIQSLKRNWEQNAWDLGEQLAKIYDEAPGHPALWKLRKDEENGGVTQLYKTFKDFLRAETGFSYEMAMSCMYVRREFTREQITMQPSSKIKIVLNAPEKDQKKLFAIAQATPVRQLREKVRESNIAAGAMKKADGKRQLKLLGERREAGDIDDKEYEQEAKKIAKESKDPTEKRREARQERAKTEAKVRDAAKGIRTIALPWQKAKVALFRESKDAKGKFIPAHSVADAWGWVEGKNGVFLVFKLIKDPQGHLKLSFEVKDEVPE